MAIEKYSFFYVQPVNMEPFLVLIEKDDTLLMRYDVPHVWEAHLTGRENVRLIFY